MNHFHWIYALLILLASSGIRANEVRVDFAVGEWIPYTSETLPEYGAAAELVSAVCKAAGIQPVYKFYPWPRAEKMVADGQVFAAFPYAITDERRRMFDFSDILFYGIDSFVYFNENPKTVSPPPYEKLQDLKGYRIGGVRGSYFEKTLKQADLDYDASTNIDQSIKKLEAGRIDLYLDDQVAIYMAIMRLFPGKVEKFKTLNKPFNVNAPTALLVSRAYPMSQEIKKRFNTGLSVIKQNGEYDRIIEKYHMLK